MKKDLEIPKVENISVAVVKEMNDEKTAEVFNVYLLTTVRILFYLIDRVT